MRQVSAAIVFSVTACLAAAEPITAVAQENDEPTESFYILMRAPNIETVPRSVTIYEDQTDTVSEAMPGCDGQTYYAAPDDAAVVAAAMANGNTVELARADLGVPAQDASIVCLIQASPS